MDIQTEQYSVKRKYATHLKGNKCKCEYAKLKWNIAEQWGQTANGASE